MTTHEPPELAERESLRVAEQARQVRWDAPSFLRELFLGNLRLKLVHPFPLPKPERPEFAAFYGALEEFLRTEVDPGEIDRTGEYPEHVLAGLRRLGAFGMTIPKKYGGLGLTNLEYGRIMTLLGGHDGNVASLISAHQSIGVPRPLATFGSDALKNRYLPRCAAGEISAFALTEPQVGSDPARVSTTAVKSADGTAYVLNGTKLWTTNGTLAKLLVVMAADPATRKISAFVVETAWPGVTVEHRCRFMGLRAISNGVLRFEDVRVPAENLIGQEGRGLKIALTTLNEGRLAIPNLCVGAARTCLAVARRWAVERVQWGKPIGRHEAIAHKIADIACRTFAMESIAQLTTALSDRGGYDIRLEAAAAKDWSTCRSWEIVDETMQIRGGRGYETEHSLAGRGETAAPVERMMRDLRVNKILEGSTEIMHLFMAREMVDKHLRLAGALIDRDSPLSTRLRALPALVAFYAWWYPTRWLGWGLWPRYREFGCLASHVRFADRTARKLARASFHGMLLHRARLQNRQAFLFRLVDIATEVLAVAACVTRARALVATQAPESGAAVAIADAFSRSTRRRVKHLFHELWRNDDVATYRLGVQLQDERHAWLERGLVNLESTPRTPGEAGSSPSPAAEEER